MSLLKMGLDNYPTNSNDYICVTGQGRVFNFNENELRYDLIGQLTYDGVPIYGVYNCVKFGNRILCWVKRISSGSVPQAFLFDTNVYNNQQYITSIYDGFAVADDEYLYSIRSDMRYIDKWYLDPVDNLLKIHSSSGKFLYNVNDYLISGDNSFIIHKASNMMKFIDKETLTETYSKSITSIYRSWLNYGDYIFYSVESGTINQIGKFVKPGTDNPNPVGSNATLLSSSGSTNANRRYICHIWKDILLYKNGSYDIGIYDLKNSTNIQSPSSTNRLIINWEKIVYNFDNFIINGYKPDTAYNVVPFGVYGSITSTTPFNSGETIQGMWKN